MRAVANSTWVTVRKKTTVVNTLTLIRMKNENVKSFENSTTGYATVHNTKATEGTQWTKYHSPSGGHGFAAEDANALNDVLHGRHVEKVGISNELNGADRIVNGQPIQTKYYNTAYKSVNAAFQDGTYRYTGQKLEVPADQYEDAVRLMADKIRQGQVSGVTDPDMAKSIVQKGSVTYQEAVNISKAGNIDSLKFDVKTQAVACGVSLGLSFVVSYAAMRYSGIDRAEALKAAVSNAVKTGAITMASGVAAQQILRTSIGRGAAAAATNVTRKAVDAFCRTTVGKEVVRRLMSSVLGKQLMQSAARNAAIRMARTNVVTATVTTVATAIPDTVKLCRGRISGKQFFKNSAVNAASVGTGAGGAWLGGLIGSAIFPGVGTVIGGLIGGIGGGVAGSAGTKKVLDNFIDDDVNIVTAALEDAITELCKEYQKSEEDLKGILAMLRQKNVFRASFFEKAYKAGGKDKSPYVIKRYLTKELRQYFA